MLVVFWTLIRFFFDDREYLKSVTIKILFLIYNWRPTYSNSLQWLSDFFCLFFIVFGIMNFDSIGFPLFLRNDSYSADKIQNLIVRSEMTYTSWNYHRIYIKANLYNMAKRSLFLATYLTLILYVEKIENLIAKSN